MPTGGQATLEARRGGGTGTPCHLSACRWLRDTFLVNI
jgi:hypothetical protein